MGMHTESFGSPAFERYQELDQEISHLRKYFDFSKYARFRMKFANALLKISNEPDLIPDFIEIWSVNKADQLINEWRSRIEESQHFSRYRQVIPEFMEYFFACQDCVTEMTEQRLKEELMMFVGDPEYRSFISTKEFIQEECNIKNAGVSGGFLKNNFANYALVDQIEFMRRASRILSDRSKTSSYPVILIDEDESFCQLIKRCDQKIRFWFSNVGYNPQDFGWKEFDAALEKVSFDSVQVFDEPTEKQLKVEDDIRRGKKYPAKKDRRNTAAPNNVLLGLLGRRQKESS